MCIERKKSQNSNITNVLLTDLASPPWQALFFALDAVKKVVVGLVHFVWKHGNTTRDTNHNHPHGQNTQRPNNKNLQSQNTLSAERSTATHQCE